MAKTIASCGHTLNRQQAITLNPVYVRAVADDGHHAARFLLLCPSCLREAQRKQCVLPTDKDRDEWLLGETEGVVW
jgi:hypothetical protein